MHMLLSAYINKSSLVEALKFEYKVQTQKLKGGEVRLVSKNNSILTRTL